MALRFLKGPTTAPTSTKNDTQNYRKLFILAQGGKGYLEINKHMKNKKNTQTQRTEIRKTFVFEREANFTKFGGLNGWMFTVVF